MTENKFKRKLTAILSADVVGYSRLMGDDEEATVKTLESYKGVMSSLIKQHRGRVVDSPGDNLLAEFGSVVDAVQCAVSIQKELQPRNAELPDSRKMEFRIGINLGDVIEEEDRIYGDGVNIAARLETLADPGGICVSKTAFDHIESKLPLGYEFLGEQTVKNIAKPVGAYRVLMETRVVDTKTKQEAKAASFLQRKPILFLGIIVILAIVAGLYWNSYLRGTSIEPASLKRMAYPLPDKPSIAVLPFTNMSGDPEQDYIGDGLSENIISVLSVIPRMFVISRSATFTYKGKSVKPQQVAEELGVQYVLEGSIQKSGERLRVSAQLIDALGGHHLWAEVYDRKMRELFELQDEITKKIVDSIGVELGGGEAFRVISKSTDNIEAWKLLFKGGQLFFHFNKEDNLKAREYFEAALELDPQYVAAMCMVVGTHLNDFQAGWSHNPNDSMNRAFELAQKAVKLDEQSPAAHGILGQVFLHKKQYEKAIAEGKQAIALSPNHSHAHVLLAGSMRYSGRFDEAITLVKKAYRLDPSIPRQVYLDTLATSFIFLRRYEEALEICKQMGENTNKAINLSWIYQEIGREEEARTYMAEVLEMSPDLSLESIQISSPYKNPDHLKRMLDALRKAGMPERAPGAVQEKPSIAVLPFDDISPDKDQEYFSDGLSEELINKLSQVKNLQVTARTSSFYFKGKNEDMRTIGEKLGVTYLLEGSVRKSGNKLRITTQLIKAVDGYHLWSETYDLELKDIFTIQDEIAEAVTTALSITLGVGAFNQPGGTRHVDAYDEYLKGQELIIQYTPNSILQAIDHLQQAVKLDPEYGMGWMLLGDAYDYALPILPPEETVDYPALLAEAMERAKAVAPEMPLILKETADTHRARGNWLEADHIYQRLLEQYGNSSAEINQGYGNLLSYAGRTSESLPYLLRARRLDPLSPSTSFHLSDVLMDLGRFDEAQAEIERGKNLAEGLDQLLNVFEWIITLETDDIQRAIGLIEDYYSNKNNDSDQLLSEAFMRQLVALVKDENIDKALNEIRQLAADESRRPIEISVLAAWSYLLGDSQLTIELLKGGPVVVGMGWWHRNLYSDARRLPGFKTLLRDSGLVNYWRETGKWPDLCHPVGDDDFACD